MPKCNGEKCSSEATHAPLLQIPAEGWPLDMHQPIEMVMGLELCEKHTDEFIGRCDEFKKENPQIGEIAAMTARAAGKWPTDYSRAVFKKVKLTSPEYLKLKRLIEGKKHDA